MIVQTDRIQIEKVTLKDASFIFKLMNTDSWIKYIGDRGVNTVHDAKVYIQNNYLKEYEKIGFGFYKMILKESNEPIGIVGFAKRAYLKEPDIGFGMLPEFEGNGYAYEASAPILNYGFSTLNFDTIGAITLESNIRSIKLIEKLGLVFQHKFMNEEDELLYYELHKKDV